jgi:predicted dehydrogenase
MKPHLTQHCVNEYSNSFPNAQESNLFKNFAKQVLSGSLNEEWPEQALKTQELLNACYQSALDDKPVTL